MRGHDEQTAHMFSYLSPEQRVPADHPLRAVRALTDEALQTMSRRFASLYATTGRPSIPPEQWLRAWLLQVLDTVRSERLLMEELTDNLLFRWFVGLNMDDPVWHPTTFTKNRDRLLSGDVAAAFFDAVQAHARAAGLLSDEHFTVDGTQLEAWASLKSFRCVDAAERDPPEDPGNPTVNFHGERRRNDTHQSTTDPDATPVARSTSIRLGDQFRLQAHVVRCGDSTDPAHVDALLGGATPHLMPTDPPYGVNYAPEWRAHVSTWCVEKAIAAATLQGVPGARPGDCVVGLLCMVMQPPEPVATDQAGRRRAHAASWQPRLRHRRGQAPGPHACGASTGRLIADALCPPDPRRSGTVSHDRTAMRCRAADLGWPAYQWCHQANARTPRVADRGRGHAEASRAVPHHVGERG